MVPISIASPGGNCNASLASDERQLRISAFKNKVATLRATSKVYNITSSSDKSINTLDSSLASSSAASSFQLRGKVGGRGQPQPQSLLGDDNYYSSPYNSPYNSPGASAEKRSPYQETNPFARDDNHDHDDDDEHSNVRAAAVASVSPMPTTPVQGNSNSSSSNNNNSSSLTLSYKRPLNPFSDSDSEVSSGVGSTSSSTSEEEEEVNVEDGSISRRSEMSTSTDGDLFADMVQAFRKVKKTTTPVVVTPEKEEESDEDDDDDEGYSTASEYEDEEQTSYHDEKKSCKVAVAQTTIVATTIQPMSLDQKIGNTGIITTVSSSPSPSSYPQNKHHPAAALMTKHSYSHRSSTSVTVNSKSSSQSFSTMDGFSIESIQESNNNNDNDDGSGDYSSGSSSSSSSIGRSIAQKTDAAILRAKSVISTIDNSSSSSLAAAKIGSNHGQVQVDAKSVASRDSSAMRNPFCNDDDDDDEASSSSTSFSNGGSSINTLDITKQSERAIQHAEECASRASSSSSSTAIVVQVVQEGPSSSVVSKLTNPFSEDVSSTTTRATNSFGKGGGGSSVMRDHDSTTREEEPTADNDQQRESAPLLRGWSSAPSNEEKTSESEPKFGDSSKEESVHYGHSSAAAIPVSTNSFADDEESKDDSIEYAANKSAAGLVHELLSSKPSELSSYNNDDDSDDDDNDSASTASTPKKQTSLGPSNNPFAELLSLRQRRKRMEMDLRLASKRSVGSANFDSSSDGASASMSSSSSMNKSSHSSTSSCAKNQKVFFVDDESKDSGITSLNGALFSDLKKTLSKIKSVSLEEEDNYDHEEKKDGEECGLEGDESNNGRPVDMQSQLVYKKGTESCGVSSLKDVSHFNEDSESDYENPFLDDDDDVDDTTTVVSVPRSPAPLMMASPGPQQVAHLLGQEHSVSEEEEESVVEENGTFETISASAAESIKKLCQDNEDARNVAKAADDNETVACSNSHQVDPHTSTRAHGTNLTPPKTNVVLPSYNDTNGSISTKDSIVGRTIAIGNGDLASERIYLESLRAQVLAELKVHVADEEIRLALDARLAAIQDYYKRKATSTVLQPNNGTTVADTLNSAAARRDNSHYHPNLPQVKPTVIHQSKSIEEHVPLSPESGPSNVIPFPDQQRENPHKFAFERVQGQMNAAIQAVHSASPTRSGSIDYEEVKEKRDDQHAEGRGADAYNRQQTETPIPMHIFTKDTFWDDEDDPSTIPNSPLGNCSRIEAAFPPSHGETIQNAWSFYRNVNGLISDSRVYDYEFSLLQEDPLYPYLNSLVGIADSGEDGFANEFKRISQPVKRDYANKSPHRICHSLAREAEGVLPELKAVCAYIGNRLGMQTMAVGPVKKPSEALLKCEKKYGGDPLLVTDYCRASLFVKDISNLLALIEIVLSKYAGIVRRIKLSSLKTDHVPLIGGYRDVKINLEIEGHICEIQVHLVPLWLLKERAGYAHYKECCEHNVDVSSFDIGKTLRGLERGTLADLIKMAEHGVKRMSIENLQQYNEDQIRDYFALANLYLSYGMPVKAETILRRIIKLRSECQHFGPCHAETLLHMERLRKCLKVQHKYKSASAVKSQISKAKKMQQKSAGEHQEPELSELCHNDQCGAIDYVCDFILDPSKKERLEEKRKADSVDESRALWLRVRRSYFN